jgi:stearoyl-CoA desaturase (delta-9 desaturase)
MKIYSLIGYGMLALHLLASGLTARPGRSFGTGVMIGFGYVVFIWFFGGMYISNVMHMGIAHKSLAFKPWFINFITLLYNTFGIYVDPVTWVNRHRHHHAFSDRPNDPNKLADDGFWKTLYLCFCPYECKSNLAQDRIFKTWTFRLVSNDYYAIFAQFTSYGVLYLILRDWWFALALWVGVRLCALWLNMIQNYWSHDRRYGTRRYADEHDNAMNVTDFLPVTASFSASLQNNHHHSPNFFRTSHDESEYDFGLMTIRAMKKLGLVNATASGIQRPEGIPLQDVGI